MASLAILTCLNPCALNLPAGGDPSALAKAKRRAANTDFGACVGVFTVTSALRWEGLKMSPFSASGRLKELIPFQFASVLRAMRREKEEGNA